MEARCVRRGVVGLADLNAVVATQVGQGPPPLSVGVEMTVDHPGVEHRTAPALLHWTRAEDVPSLRLKDGEVVVELHSRQRDAATRGGHHRIGHERDRRMQRHSFFPCPLRRDPMDRRRLRRDVTTGVDQAGPAPDHHPFDDGHQCVGHRDVVEAVDPCRLEVESQHLSGRPSTHAARALQRAVTQPRILPPRGRPGTEPADRPLRSPHCYGPADDRFGPCCPARPARGDRGGALRARCAGPCDPFGPPRRGQPAACIRRSRPGGTCPSARRHRDRTGEPGHGRRIPGSRRPLRHAAVEPGHQPEHRAGRRWL